MLFAIILGGLIGSAFGGFAGFIIGGAMGSHFTEPNKKAVNRKTAECSKQFC